jgi:hypothetical protein
MKGTHDLSKRPPPRLPEFDVDAICNLNQVNWLVSCRVIDYNVKAILPWLRRLIFWSQQMTDFSHGGWFGPLLGHLLLAP